MDNHDHADAAIAGTAFAWAVALNLGLVLAQAGFGLAAGSLALIADAPRNLTDVAGLLIAWGAPHLARRPPTSRHTYGLGCITILAGAGAIAWEAARRIAEPAPVAASTVLWVAVGGIIANLLSALFFPRDRHRDQNLQGMFLHLLGDAAVSDGMVGAAVVILATGWRAIDPIATILVSLAVGWSALGLLRSAIHLSLDGVPLSIDRAAIERRLRGQPGVAVSTI